MDLKELNNLLESLKAENENICLPDYQKSTLNLSASILQHFGIKADHETFPPADEMLSQNFTHVVVVVLSGLGMNILEKHLYYKDFLRRNLLTDYSSVLNPKSPIENGLQDYESIIEKINNSGNAKAYSVLPFGENPHTELNDWIEAIRKTCKNEQKTFTYAFWQEPDATLHQKGTKSNDVAKIVAELNEKMTYLCEETPHTLFFITADHGHTDIRNDFLQENYPDITKMLSRQPSMEARAISFFVKPEYLQTFPEEFKRTFYKDYILLTKEEALTLELFGPDNTRENPPELGDFIALAITPRTLLWNKSQGQYKSHHSGLTKAEMRIPLISYNSRPRHFGTIIYYSLVAMAVIVLLLAIF